MGETQPEVVISVTEVEQTNYKERRNGMWNIFEGVDSAVLEKLGLSRDMIQELVAGADDTVSQRLSQLASHLSRESLDDDCTCQRARIYRSLSASVGEEMQAALKNRHRRNAVGNLFDILTPSQKLLLVERLQEQLKQLDELSCLCDAAGNVSSNGNSDVLLSLSDLTRAVSTTPGSTSTSPRSAASEIVSCS